MTPEHGRRSFHDADRREPPDDWRTQGLTDVAADRAAEKRRDKHVAHEGGAALTSALTSLETQRIGAKPQHI